MEKQDMLVENAVWMFLNNWVTMQFIPEDFLLDVFLFLIPFYFVFLFDRVTNIKLAFYTLGLKPIKFKELLKNTITIFLLLFFLSYLLSFFSVLFNVSDLELVGKEILSFPFSVIIYLFVIRVFLEEWFFRGFLVPRIGIIFSSLIFALGHLSYGSVIQVLGAFVLGVFLANTYTKTNNLWPNVFAHALYNLTIYLFLVL